jgi:hypothetical protein
MTQSLWLELLEFGRWAPSPHNMQSWRFRIETDDSVTLLFDPDRLLPDTDPTGRFCTVGFGILLETLMIAAAPHHLAVHAEFIVRELDPHKKGPQPFARLTLVPRSSEETLSRQLILDRRTSRLPYDGVPVAQAVLDELSAVAGNFGHKLEFSTEPKQVDWVVRLNAETMFFDMSEARSRNEVGHWMRFSYADACARADGLAAYAMHFPGWLMRQFVVRNWLFTLAGVFQMVRAFYVRSMRGTRTVAWLSGPFEVHEDWVNAGRMMARLWLTMTKHGVYLHPFGSVITNPKSHALMAEHFANADRQHDLWMLVRLGHSELPPQAKRIPLAQLLVS